MEWWSDGEVERWRGGEVAHGDMWAEKNGRQITANRREWPAVLFGGLRASVS
jgi:hypothetical protein